MTADITIQLIQFIALALPAIGIYMTFSLETRMNHRAEFSLYSAHEDPAISSPFGHAYHGMRVGILFLVGAGIILFVHLLIILPPDLPYREPVIFGIGLEYLFFTFGVISMMIGITFFGFAVAFQQTALRDDLDVVRSSKILFIDQTRAAFLRLMLYLPRKVHKRFRAWRSGDAD